jgi:hypothetical protein
VKATLKVPADTHGEVWHWKRRADGLAGTLIIYRQLGYASWIPHYLSGDDELVTLSIDKAEDLIKTHVLRQLEGDRSIYSKLEQRP